MTNKSFLSELKKRLNEPLPGEVAHQLVMPKGRPSSSDIRSKENDYRESAVSVIIHTTSNIPECVLIQRPPYDGVHGGQVGFPGGKRELSDPDLIYTARRESNEEIGFPIESGELIGQLTEVAIPVSKFLVSPYVFWIDELPSLIPDAREVDTIFSCDLAHLSQQEILRTSIPIQNGIVLKDMPYFDIDNRVVWGATALMLAELKMILNDIF